MGSQEHLGIVEPVEFIVTYGVQPHLLQTTAFLAVMDDVAQAIEGFAPMQFFLGLVDGPGHTVAEAAAFVDFDGHRVGVGRWVQSRDATAKAPLSQAICSSRVM